MPRTVLPAEWAPQEAVVLTWPHAHADWGDALPDVEQAFAAFAAAIARFENLWINCYDAQHRRHVGELLERAHVAPQRYRCVVVPSNDVWARDHGPITVWRGNRRVWLDFQFNGWGGKFPADLDNAVNGKLRRAIGLTTLPLESQPLILEGGSIDSDGQGTLLTTSRCLLAPNRNAGTSSRYVEGYFQRVLGVERVLWLDHGCLEGDDTDGHVDMLARFCSPGVIAYTACDDLDDPQYSELLAMAEELRAFTTAAGAPYQLLALPWPRARYNSRGERLPLSYANFLIVNGGVLVPQYGDPADQAAITLLSQAFPDRRVVGVDALPLIQQSGSLHCASMQIPIDPA